jgi:hypothetical protein
MKIERIKQRNNTIRNAQVVNDLFVKIKTNEKDPNSYALFAVFNTHTLHPLILSMSAVNCTSSNASRFTGVSSPAISFIF